MGGVAVNGISQSCSSQTPRLWQRCGGTIVGAQYEGSRQLILLGLPVVPILSSVPRMPPPRPRPRPRHRHRRRRRRHQGASPGGARRRQDGARAGRDGAPGIGSDARSSRAGRPAPVRSAECWVSAPAAMRRSPDPDSLRTGRTRASTFSISSTTRNGRFP